MNPWNEGYGARYDCKPRESNPYPAKDYLVNHEAWDIGWFFADSEIKTM